MSDQKDAAKPTESKAKKAEATKKDVQSTAKKPKAKKEKSDSNGRVIKAKGKKIATIDINTEIMGDRLKFLKNAIASNPEIPVLSDIAFSGKNGMMEIIATNMTAYASARMPYVGPDFQFTADYGNVAKIVAKCKGVISLTIFAGRISFSDNKSTWTIPRFDFTDFPIREPLTEHLTTIVVHQPFFDKLASAVPFTGNSGERLNMTGICLDIKKDGLSIVATDANKLILESFPCTPEGDKVQYIVPKQIAKFVSVFKNATLEFGVRAGEGAESFRIVTLRNSEYQVSLNLIDATYPSYAAIIPNGEDYTTVTFDKSELMSACEKIKIVSNETTREGDFEIEENSLILKTKCDMFTREGETKIKSENILSANCPNQICLNLEKLISVVQSISEESISMQIFPQVTKKVKGKEIEVDSAVLLNGTRLLSPIYKNS